MSDTSLYEIAEILAEYSSGLYGRRLDLVGDRMDELRRTVNELGVALGESRLVDDDFEVLLQQLTSIAALDLDERLAEDRGTESFRALAMGLNMLTEELDSVLRSRAAAEERYRSAFMLAPIGMVMTNADGANLQVNPAFARLLGYDHASFPFDRWQDAIHPDDVMALEERMARMRDGAINQFEIEKRHVTVDGEPIWAQVSVAAIRDERGRFLHTIGQVVDIDALRKAVDALRRARDRAQEADRLKTEFLRNMSHEIRTPMTSILGMTELALATELSPEAREYLEVADLSGRALLDLVDDLLNLSKIEAGRLEPDTRAVDPRIAVEDAVRPLAARADAAGVAFDLTFEDAMPALVECDPGWVAQIVTNLVGNAVKFTEAGSVSVTVRCLTSDEGNVLGVRVADTGIGVPEDRRHLIFDPFSQADGSANRTHGGTGLGLAISQRLAGLMGGRIWLDDAPRERGSVFHAELPVGAAAAITASRPDKPVALPAMTGRALVAEDHEANRLLLTQLLRRAGFEVSAVADGRGAITAVLESDFTVVLMDLQMPNMGGLDAIAAIRAMGGAIGRVPIIAVTAFALDRDRDLALTAGADAFLAKPFSGDALMEAVRRVVPAPAR